MGFLKVIYKGSRRDLSGFYKGSVGFGDSLSGYRVSRVGGWEPGKTAVDHPKEETVYLQV